MIISLNSHIKDVKEYAVSSKYERVPYGDILKLLPVPILVTSFQAVIVYVNPAWERLTGFSAEEVVGKNPRIFQSGKTAKIVYAHMWHNLRLGKPFSTENIIDIKKSKKELYTHTIIFPLQFEGTPKYYIQITYDITPKKRLEELEKEYMATTTHELKTPLTVLLLLVQMQIRKLSHYQNFIDQKKILEQIQVELVRLQRIIHELSDVSKIELYKLHLELQPFPIKQCIKLIVNQMKKKDTTHRITCKMENDVVVIGDQDRIKQVFINLLHNAQKYSYPTSTIEVRCTIEDNVCVVSIANTGIGIPKDKQPFIFDKFYQVHEGNDSSLGLGLYISKKIIEAHKGKMWVESVEGEVTTFSFSLPIAK